jgi:hypothetical protein
MGFYGKIFKVQIRNFWMVPSKIYKFTKLQYLFGGISKKSPSNMVTPDKKINGRKYWMGISTDSIQI